MRKRQEKEMLDFQQLFSEIPQDVNYQIPPVSSKWIEVGALNIEELIKYTIIPSPRHPIQIKYHFKTRVEGKLKYFQFAQVNTLGELNGLARSVEDGEIEEIQYRAGKKNGWGRIINEGQYSMGWYYNDKKTGYAKIIYNDGRLYEGVYDKAEGTL